MKALARLRELAELTTESKRLYLNSLADQLEGLKCKVNRKLLTEAFNPTLSVTFSKYPMHWCLTQLGWDVESGSNQRHVYIRKDGSWPITVIWRGSSFITMGRPFN